MDKVNEIDMEFIFKKRGHSPETKRQWTERNHILKPDKTRIVGKGKESEMIQEYRPNQAGRKRIAELNIEIYNGFFHYCETLNTTPLQEFQQNNNESWINNHQSDGESQTSRTKQDKCPTNALRRFRKHETVNRIRLKQTAKLNTLEPEQNEKTADVLKKAEKDFALDSPLLCGRDSTRCQNPEHNCRNRTTTAGKYLLSLPPPPSTSVNQIRIAIL